MPSAVECSAYVALVAVGLLAANLLLGLLMAGGFNPARHWPHRSVKLFRLHNWTGYIALTAAPSFIQRFCCFRRHRHSGSSIRLLPIWSPVQPVSNVLGAISLYLVIIVVATAFLPAQPWARHLWRIDSLRQRMPRQASSSCTASSRIRRSPGSAQHRLHRWREGTSRSARSVPGFERVARCWHRRSATPGGTRARLTTDHS
jgi:hypothetical protein